MKTPLVELVRQRNKTKAFHFFDQENQIDEHLKILHDTVCANLDERLFHQEVRQHHENISVELAEIRMLVRHQLEIFEHEIRQLQDDYFERSQKIYDETMFDDPEYILQRTNGHHFLHTPDSEIRDLFVTRLSRYNDWRKPGLQIHPAHGKITDYIKGCDPLYLLDTHEDLFAPVRKLFNETYQRRLRYYTFNERANNPLDILPKNQFGLIVVTDWFNYKTMQMTVKYLKDFFELLCNGGVVVFTYNNCDTPEGVEKVDDGFQTYIPGNMLKGLVSDLGYEIIKFVDAGGQASWAEIKKPGEIETIRGGQTLAEIRQFVQNL